MSRIKTHKIEKHEFDDLINALGASRAELADICGVKKDAPGWWRFQERIPLQHLEVLGRALEKKLKKRISLNPVEKRAITFVRTSLAGGSAVSLNQKSPFFDDSGHKTAQRLSGELVDLTVVNLEDLIKEIKRRGGSVHFGKLKKSISQKT